MRGVQGKRSHRVLLVIALQPPTPSAPTSIGHDVCVRLGLFHWLMQVALREVSSHASNYMLSNSLVLLILQRNSSSATGYAVCDRLCCPPMIVSSATAYIVRDSLCCPCLNNPCLFSRPSFHLKDELQKAEVLCFHTPRFHERLHLSRQNTHHRFVVCCLSFAKAQGLGTPKIVSDYSSSKSIQS